jgi:hypothetical protein
VAGRKVLTVTLEDDDLHGRVEISGLPCAVQLFEHLVALRVRCLRPIERDHPDRIRNFVDDMFELHVVGHG